MKGILLAGGSGKRLHPMTAAVNKHLLPIYDKPMAFYPLSTLMLSGVREILIVTTPRDEPLYRELFGDGSQLGLRIEYAAQPRPEGIAQAFIIGERFIGKDSVTLVLGDNILYGHTLSGILQDAVNGNQGATVFGYYMKNPQEYGTAVFNGTGDLMAIEEKPAVPKSNYAITGFYVYDNQVVSIAKGLEPSARGELEITAVNNEYLRRGRLKLVKLGRGIAWLDTGNPQALVEATNFIATLEHRQSLKVACLEEVAFRMGYIDAAQLRRLADAAPKGQYATYLRSVVEEERP